MTQHSVLVVGDDPALRAAIRLNLEGEGVRVYETNSAAGTWTGPEAQRPDACILDLHAPTATEWTKLPMVRGWSGLKDVPVLVVADEPPDPTWNESWRPDAHLLKPFNAADLVRNVQRMLKKGKR